MTSTLFKQLVWDYDITQAEFEAILAGKKVMGSFDQNWAITRVLENANYYDAMDLVSLNTLRSHWADIQSRLFKSSIKSGYEFLLQRYPVSTTGQSA